MRRPSAALSCSPPASPRALTFLLVTVYIDILGLGLVVPIAPQLVASLGGGSVYFGVLVAGYGLLQWLATPLLGALSDRYGRRPVLFVSLTMLGVDYLAQAMSPVLWWLLLSRALAGATAATFTVVNAYVADVTPPSQRTRAYALVSATSTLGFIAGPAIGGLLGGINLRLPFYAAAALALLNVCYGLLVLPEPHSPHRRPPIHWRLANPVTAFLALARRPDVGRLAWARLYGSIAVQMQQVTWALYAIHRYGWSTGQVGAAVAAAAVVGAAAQVSLTDRCTRRFGEKATAVFGQAMWAASLVMTGLAPYDWMLYPLLAIGSLGAMTGPPTLSWLSRVVSDRTQGTVHAALTSASSLTETVVPVPAAALFTWSVAAGWPGLVPVCAAVVVLVGIAHIVRAGRPPADATSDYRQQQRDQPATLEA